MVNILRRVKVNVCGRVQNVGYRNFAARVANTCHVVGYVKNQSDGSVLLEAEGAETDIARLVHELKKGPGFASVTSIDVMNIACREDEEEFTIKY